MINRTKSTETYTITASWPSRSESLKEKYSHAANVGLNPETGRNGKVRNRMQKQLNKNSDRIAN